MRWILRWEGGADFVWGGVGAEAHVAVYSERLR